MKSLAVHSKLGEGLEEVLDENLISEAVHQTIYSFAEAQWEIPEDFMLYSHFERVVRELDWNSSPGYPYLLQYSTNRQLFQVEDGEPSLAAKLMVWELVNKRLELLDADPVRLFVKPEPHKLEKISTGRLRLISSVSVVDQILDHMIFGEMNQQITDNYMELPSKVGWSPYGGGWKIVPAGRMVATDKKAWDWTVKEWLVQAELRVRSGLCKTRGWRKELWLKLAAWRYRKLFIENIFVTSGGHFLRQLRAGIMKSGCVNTIHTNSIMQFILHIICCLLTNQIPRAFWSMGDDVLQALLEDMKAYLRAMSKYCLLKPACSKTEFAGNEFKPGGVVEPLYHSKHCFNLLHVDPSLKREMTYAYSLLYHRSSKSEMVNKILNQLGLVPEPEFLSSIFDGQ